VNLKIHNPQQYHHKTSNQESIANCSCKVNHDYHHHHNHYQQQSQQDIMTISMACTTLAAVKID
jgi:hypothetical protein